MVTCKRIVNATGKAHQNQNQRLSDDFVRWLYKKKHVTDGSIIYSEVYLKDNSLLRGTPNHLGSGPWFDWVTYWAETDTRFLCPFQILGFFINKADNDKVYAFGKSGDWEAPPPTKHKLLTKWKIRKELEVLDLDTIVKPRVFALQVPRISKHDNVGAQVGNMLPWADHPEQVERRQLLDDEAFLFSDRLFESDQDVDCWPRIFMERSWNL